MGSLRTPIGPLPSSIYWRRRAVVLLLLLFVAALVFWGLRAGSPETTSASEDDRGGDEPPASITPGATDTESHIDERPGGPEDGDEEDNGDEEEAEDSENGGADGGGSGREDDADGGESDSDGTDGAGGGSGGNAPGDLPSCTAGEQLTVSLRTEENAYSPDEEPALRLTLENETDVDCGADIGHDALTVTLSHGDTDVWNSAHCPQGAASRMVEVPAGDTATHTVDWDRRASDPDACDEAGAAAPDGTYLAEATLDGFGTVQTTFRLDAA